MRAPTTKDATAAMAAHNLSSQDWDALPFRVQHFLIAGLRAKEALEEWENAWGREIDNDTEMSGSDVVEFVGGWFPAMRKCLKAFKRIANG